MRRAFALLLWLMLLPATALARPVIVEGTVVDATSRWTRDGSRIVTEAIVQTADGAQVAVSQLGGTVDGLTMRTFPGPELLAPGMQVAVAGTERPDLSQRLHVAVDSVRVLYLPPQFVRTGPTRAGAYLYWESGCVFVTPDLDGTRQLLADLEQDIIEASVQTWNEATAGCSYLDLRLDAPRKQEVGRDNVNVIKFRDVSWCRPATDDDPARCHAASAAGLTTVVYVDDSRSSRDGAIVDADIELNAVSFAISVNGESGGTQACKADLQNTLTHELGHLLGLEHPCRVSDDPVRVDHTGAQVPMCGAVLDDPKYTEVTMFNFQDCGETKKQSLEPDDINAICAIYPAADDPRTCERLGDGAGCCSASRGTGVPWGAVLGALGLGALLLGRRRSPAPPARRS